jgi:RNA polymerase sigma-70 factor (ECF subfamily)
MAKRHRAVEAALIADCLNGRLEAFEDLVAPYQDRLFNTILRLCGNADDAAELLQETLIAAFRGLGSFQSEASFYTWVYRVAVNQVFSSRRRQRVPAVSADALAAGGGLEPSDERRDVSPAHRLETGERQALVERTLAELPDDFRTVLVLKDIEGLKYEEIAEILDIPIGTVRSRLHRARADMRERLRPLWESGEL